MKERLRELVLEVSEMTFDEPVAVEIADDDFLPDILDSLAIATLVTLIEEEWSLEIDDTELERAHFADLESLAAFVKRKVQTRE